MSEYLVSSSYFFLIELKLRMINICELLRVTKQTFSVAGLQEMQTYFPAPAPKASPLLAEQHTCYRKINIEEKTDRLNYVNSKLKG